MPADLAGQQGHEHSALVEHSQPRRHDADRRDAGPPDAEHASSEQPSAEHASAEQPSAEQPSAEQPSAEPTSAEQPSAEQPSAEQPSAEQPSAEPTSAEPTSAERAAIGQPGTGQPGAGRRGARHGSPVRLIRRPWAAVAAVVGMLVICAAAVGLALASHTGRQATPVGHAPLVPIPAGHYAAAPAAKAEPVPMPTALVIPEIGVRTRLIHLGLTASGALQVPASYAVAGWYTGSPRPGATGSAVIAGHIDSVSGPGVFFRLRELRPGELIYVQRRHAAMVAFKVTAVSMYLKSKFPTDAVYGPVPNAQLRLITCGGTFDPATGHYLSNVVVFAVLQ
jgi:hypothetical protein